MISGVNERFAGRILGSKSKVHEKIFPLSYSNQSVILIVQLPFNEEPTKPSIESTDEYVPAGT